MSRLFRHALTGAGLAVALSSCTSPQVASTCAIPELGQKVGTDNHPATAADRDTALKACFNQVSNNYIDTTLQKDLDILFLIDNSPSMSPKQKALAAAIPQFIAKIDATGANYHVGITTSDVGSYTAPGTPWSVSLGSCNSFEGDDGALQRVACNTRTGVTSGALDACNSLCPDPSFVPVDGKGFISKINGVNNIKGADPMAPQKAFQCMALVGDAGCGIEGQLDGAKRALDGHNPMNTDFLRPNSVLAVIFITDEDDCSVTVPSGRKENDPVTMDCAAPDKNAPYNCYNPDYRCVARDMECTEPLNQTGVKTGCHEKAQSYLEPVSTYVNFFQSLRPSSKLLISGIWSPAIGANKGADNSGQFIVSYTNGGTKSDTLNRGLQTDGACYKADEPAIFGRPQVRLSKFIAQFKDSIEQSVCNVTKYPDVLDNIASAIKTKLEAQCINVVPKLLNNKPVCLVGDVDDKTPNNAPDQPFPVCSDTCCKGWAAAPSPTAEDPGVKAACAGEATDSCFCALPSTQAGVCANGAVAGIWRKGMAPAGKVTNFRCARQ